MEPNEELNQLEPKPPDEPQKLNGEDKDPPAVLDDGPKEIEIPDDKARALVAASEIIARTKAEVEIAQARFAAAQSSYDAIYFRTFAQCGANPDDYEMKAEGKKLKFVKSQK